MFSILLMELRFYQADAFSKYFYRQIEKFGNRLGGKVICCSSSELNAYLRLGIEATYISNGITVDEKIPA